MEKHDFFSVLININFPSLVSFFSFFVFLFLAISVYVSSSEKTKEIKTFILFCILYCFFCAGWGAMHLMGDFLIDKPIEEMSELEILKNIEIKRTIYFFNIIAAVGYCFYIPATIHFLTTLYRFVGMGKVVGRAFSLLKSVVFPLVVSLVLFVSGKTIALKHKSSEPLNVSILELIFVVMFYVFNFLNYIISTMLFYSIFIGSNVPIDYKRTYIGGVVDVPNTDNLFFSLYMFILPIWLVSVVLLTVFLFVKARFEEDKRGERQVIVLFAGGMIALVGGVISNHVLPMFGINLPPMASFFEGIFAVFISFSITKYKFVRHPEDYADFKEDANQFVFVVDRNGFITYINTSVRKLFLLSDGRNANLSRERIDTFLNSKSSKDSNLFSIESLESKDKKETFLVLKDDTERCFEIFFSQLKDSVYVVGYKVVLHDVTDRVLRRELLEKYNFELEVKVQERTKELQEQLEINRRQLVTIQRQLDGFRVYAGSTVANYFEKGEDPRESLAPTLKRFFILFLDIRRFTSITERMTPFEAVEFLNSLLRAFGGCVKKTGEINKFIGDAMMAWFETVDAAVSATIAIMQKLYLLNLSREIYADGDIGLGLGLNFGEVTLANIGIEDRMEVTIIGDPVNLASRLESFTSYYGCPILISGEVFYQLQADSYNIVFVDEVRVKGKEVSTKIYEVIDYKDQETQRIIKGMQPNFMKARQCYSEGDFDNAIRMFEAIKNKFLSFGITRPLVDVYIDRSKRMQAENKKRDDWFGVFVFNDKHK